jgi:hypothetical protein
VGIIAERDTPEAIRRAKTPFLEPMEKAADTIGSFTFWCLAESPPSLFQRISKNEREPSGIDPRFLGGKKSAFPSLHQLHRRVFNGGFDSI